MMSGDEIKQSAVLPRVAKGDAEAVQECIDRYGRLVWSLALRHSPSRGEAEDAVQEIFIALWESAARYDPGRASEAAFISTIARRRLIDQHRRRQRRIKLESLDEKEYVEPETPGRHVEACAEAALAARAIDRLQPKERNVVLLSAYHGMSHGQIAEHTGLPLGTVKTYVRRGLSRVKDMLQGGLGGLEEVRA